MNIQFICAGAQKSGTTTLFNLLRQNPSIYIPAQKEIYFFDNDRYYKKGQTYYQSYYKDRKDNQIAGDITADYMLFPKCAKRIKETCGDNVKLLFVLRNPVDRAYSNYQMNKKMTIENLSFEKAIDKEKKRTSSNYIKQIHYSYKNRGFYYDQLVPYYELFSKSNIKIIIFEEMILELPKTIYEIEIFLGVDHFLSYNYEVEENRGFLPKKRWIAYIKRHFIKPINKIYNRYIPEKIRMKIHAITDVGQLPIQTIEPSLYERLYEEYNESITKLEGLINRKIKLWDKEKI